MQADLEGGRQEEKESLLPGAIRSARQSITSAGLDLSVPKLDVSDTCVIKYDPIDLTSLRTLMIVKGSIFGQAGMWYIMGVVLSITAVLAFGIVELIERNPKVNAESFSTATISSVISTVTVAMAFLLGLFVNNAMARWWDIIKRFEALFGAVKRLSMSLININADPKLRREAARRGVLSIEMLRFEKVVEKLEGKAEDNWAKKFANLRSEGNITEEEQHLLEAVPSKERSFYCWAMVGKSMQPLVEHKMYRDIYRCVLEGSSAVSSLKTSATFMFPFLYVHMLAWLVHAVNIMTAICCGITVGIVIARGRQAKEPPDASAIFKEFLFLFIQVFLYQAFLAIGCALSFPVVPRGRGAMYRLPLSEMVKASREQLETYNKMADEKRL